ncbi:hypothetical protein [Georgenia sp. SUBG003]|uniref:hypothetical protein n=1 Tax=Georgenia sp. SUBG003 TaxID=1497974 RepID=UPI003AB8C284
MRTTTTSSGAPSACATTAATGTPPRGRPSTDVVAPGVVPQLVGERPPGLATVGVRLLARHRSVPGAREAAGADGAARGAADGAASEVLQVPDVDAARTLLEERLRRGDVVLLKGSNGSGIWRLADALLEGTTGRTAS